MINAIDVGDAEDVQALASQAIEKYGGIDTWINNAGVGVIGRFDRIPLDDYKRVLQTNLLGSFYGSYAAMRHFTAKGKGGLINILYAWQNSFSLLRLETRCYQFERNLAP